MSDSDNAQRMWLESEVTRLRMELLDEQERTRDWRARNSQAENTIVSLRAELAAVKENFDRSLGYCDYVDTPCGILVKTRAELSISCQVQGEMAKREDEVAAAIGAEYLLDPPDGGDVSLAEGVERIKSERDDLRALLEKARPYVYGKTISDRELGEEIDAALNKGGNNEGWSEAPLA